METTSTDATDFFKKENTMDNFIITWKRQNMYKILEKCNLQK